MSESEGKHLDLGSQYFESRTDVLHVLEAALGGTRRYLENIALACRDSGLRFALIYSTKRADQGFLELLDQLRAAGWTLREVSLERAVGPIDLYHANVLRAIIRQLDPRIVHCHSSKAGALVRLATLGLGKKPTVLYSPHALATGRIFKYVERLLAPLTSRYVAVSESERGQIASLGLAREEDISVVYPSIDSAYFAPRSQADARARLGFGQSVVTIVAIGRLVAQKNPIEFLNIFARISRERSNVRAVWVGEGPLSDEFDRTARMLGIEDRTTRRMWANDVRDEIAAADVVVSTSLFESFGFIVAESMAMGRPVVATRVTGTTDVLHGTWRSQLYASGDVEAACRLIGREIDGVLSEHLESPRRYICERFSSESMRQQLLELYAGIRSS